MKTLKEYDEQILWIESDEYKWELRFVVGVPLMIPWILLLSIVGCLIMEKVPAWEPYTRYNIDEIYWTSVFISYPLGVLTSCLFCGTKEGKNKTIKEIKQEKANHIADIKKIIKGEK